MNRLVYPMYALVLLSFAVALRLFMVRLQALFQGKIKMSYFRNMSGTEISEELQSAARHFVNLFEVPVLFYAVCLLAISLQMQSELLVDLAWVFVICRFLHATIHLTYNNVRHRVVTFFVGFLSVIAMWTIVVVGI